MTDRELLRAAKWICCFAAGLMVCSTFFGQLVLSQTTDSVSSTSDSTAETYPRFQGTRQQKESKLQKMDSGQLEELRRRKLKFEQLSEAQRKQVETIHGGLARSADGASLRAVMNRYYQWLKTLDEKTQRDLLGLPADQRIEKIRQLRDAQAKELFGRVGASKLPDEDVDNVYEWFKKAVIAKKDEIELHLNTEEVKERLPSSIRPSVSIPARTSRQSNYRFNLLVTYAPEFARDIAYEEFANLRAELSPAALEIVDGYEEEEQKDLVFQWINEVIYAQTHVTDDKLKQFWLSLPPEEHEKLELMSQAEWRNVLETRYIHSLRVNAPTSDSPEKRRSKSMPGFRRGGRSK